MQMMAPGNPRHVAGAPRVSSIVCLRSRSPKFVTPSTTHVKPVLARKADDPEIGGDAVFLVWGAGTPAREFPYSDDVDDVCVA